MIAGHESVVEVHIHIDQQTPTIGWSEIPCSLRKTSGDVEDLEEYRTDDCEHVL